MRIFTETIREGRNILISVTTIVVALIILVILMYPGPEEAIKVFTSLENAGIYELFIDATYGEGGEYRMWLAFEVFSHIFFLPVFMMILLGTSVFASEQDNNRLDILMSMPLSRSRIFIEKWFSMLVYAILFVSVGFLFSWIPSELLNYSMPVDIVFVTWLLMLPLLLFVGTLSAFFGVFFLERFKARLAMVGIVAGMFILTILSRVNDALESLNYLSVFRYFNGADIILKTSLEEIDLVDPIILLLITVITLILILWWVERKDLIPHYDSENNDKKEGKTGKMRGIPRTFFYISRFRDRLPCFVEQITADRMIINLFLLFA
ncbi:MAG: ABC transporter permease subunit, partial [Candidatus Hodarchaeales archaeon]